MASRRSQRLPPVWALLGVIFGLDLLWAALAGSTGTVLFGPVDEPAHLATCVVALAALARLSGRRPTAGFAAAALLASVAIDLDHLPAYLGLGGMLGGGPRPDTHSLLTALGFLGLGFLASRRYCSLMLGAAFGILAHLLRDAATGPGVPLFFPLDVGTVHVPYAAYAAALVVLAAVATGRIPRRRRLGIATAAAAVALCLCVGLGAVAPPSGEAAAKHRRPDRVAMGIYMPHDATDPAALDTFTNAVGHQPAIVHIYSNWSSLPFDHAELDSVWARGAVPLVTWEPWGEFEGTGIPLGEIVAGGRDAYIAEAARQAASWGGTFFVRFAHEMNGGWYPWGTGGNTPALYKAAWRHVVSIFRAEGADNVRWVWTPYADAEHLPFQRYYPGDKWVDWAGLDGFNWGRPYASFQKIFSDSYEAMVHLTDKPLMIAETGTVEGAGTAKAVWLRQAVKRALPRFPHVRAVVWFSDVHPSGTDWRIDTSPGALSAFGHLMRLPQFEVPRGFLFATPPWLRRRR